ncbi:MULTISPECIES: hypothetical protein [Corynebacterium]|uniref:DNA-binding protein n=3 Tax=Corynebacterium TaxID=1716 RepID=A0ABD7MRX4_CORUL|nr:MULTISPECIES: hypothetical protein [Corynebacterium]AEG81660.1 hypothetical protein CULC809_01127 [Corynebacterium ulcerans 809]AEG83852.1 hypothetical protein CULC22_01142 [Corynebacterium ulcerans BR-AD22]AIU30477.1 DNA-binding protein [Corynebacterium ulcerans]AIU32728.1 DNA-binding protein [Corynebacterium ramonii FRC0011]AIU91775.1 DNA-binding protein [Corynebacterium ulcerans]
MFAIHARYRGRERRRAQFVQQSARALSTLKGVDEFTVVGVEDIASVITTAEAACDTVMALIAGGDWAIGIGVLDSPTATRDDALVLAATALGNSARGGTIKAKVKHDKNWADSIQSAFSLLNYVLSRRTPEGREATSLMRSGFNQNEAAAELGISKQAMSQRLQAAGWQAELSGYRLAIQILKRANRENA